MTKKYSQKILFLVIILFELNNSYAADLNQCNKEYTNNIFRIDAEKQSLKIRSPLGILKIDSCYSDVNQESFSYIILDKKVLLKSKSVTYNAINNDNSILIFEPELSRDYTGGMGILYRCVDSLYLLDLHKPKPRLFSFGSKDACNTLDIENHHGSIKWYKDGAKIILPESVEFFYSNGIMEISKNPDKHWPLIDTDSPSASLYFGKKKYPNIRYEIFPPFSNEIKLDW